MTVRKEQKRLKAAILDQVHWMRELRAHRFDLAIDLRTGTRGAIIAGFSGAGMRIGRFAADGRLWRNRVFTHLVTPPDEACQYAAEHNLNILFPLDLKIRDRALADHGSRSQKTGRNPAAFQWKIFPRTVRFWLFTRFPCGNTRNGR